MTRTNQAPTEQIAATLGLETHARRRRTRMLIVLALAALALLAVLGYLFLGEDGDRHQYRTEPVVRGNLTVSVTATGNLQPVNQVEVGTEVSGTIDTLEADFNDRVQAGDILARLDTERLEAQVAQSSATLAIARAQLAEAQADVAETRSQLSRLERGLKLTPDVTSAQDLEAARARLQRAQASEARARAQIDEAAARLRMDRSNLDKALIRAPIDGIVLERRVEPGQTVVASMQTPVLFVLAENLTQMELHVDVDEADVGQVSDGQRALFTVDAYPERKFEAVITQVRFAPRTAEGVVSYETVLEVDNSDLALRPGMTATANVVVEAIEDAVLVPNAALRYTPPVAREGGDGGLLGAMLPRPPHARNERRSATGGKQVWVLRDGEPAPVEVRTGPSDGRRSVVLGGELEPGARVIVETLSPAS